MRVVALWVVLGFTQVAQASQEAPIDPNRTHFANQYYDRYGANGAEILAQDLLRTTLTNVSYEVTVTFGPKKKIEQFNRGSAGVVVSNAFYWTARFLPATRSLLVGLGGNIFQSVCAGGSLLSAIAMFESMEDDTVVLLQFQLMGMRGAQPQIHWVANLRPMDLRWFLNRIYFGALFRMLRTDSSPEGMDALFQAYLSETPIRKERVRDPIVMVCWIVSIDEERRERFFQQIKEILPADDGRRSQLIAEFLKDEPTFYERWPTIQEVQQPWP